MNGAVLAVHGGAWAVPEKLWSQSIEGVKAAARVGYKVLQNGGSAVDAAEATVVYLEDCPAFDAGTGSVLTYDEQVELDAIIMDGHTLKAGAVAAIKNIRNPVKVARLVMDKTQHILLAGSGANKFAKNHGHKEVDPDTLITPYAREELAEYKKYSHAVNSLFNKPETQTSIQAETCGHDTVGCAVLDNNGHLACATSTGGITAKMPGRVGDSPIVGAGGYADNTAGAVSTTGHGEAIIKVCLARHITSLLATGSNSADAVTQILSYMESRVNGFGGAVVVSKFGDVAAQFSTPRMPWAYIKNGKLHFGIHIGQHEIEEF